MMTGKKISFVGPFLVSLAVTALALLIGRKPVPLVDKDLKFVRKVVAEQENAFPLLTKAAAVSYWPIMKHRELSELSSGEKWDADLAEEVLAKNKESLALLERAMACAELQVPVQTDYNEPLQYLDEWRKLARLASIQAGKLFRDGKEQEALALALKIVHFGQRGENSGGSRTHYLTSLGIKQIGLRHVRQIAWETTLPPDQLIACIAKLEMFRANALVLTNTLKCEYYLVAKHIEDFSSGKLSRANSRLERMAESSSSKLVLDLNQSKNLMAQDIRVLLGSIPRHFGGMPLSEISGNSARSEKPSMFFLILSGNSMGKLMVWLEADSWTSVLTRKCQENSSVGATQLVLALKCYHLKHARLPDALGELVPEFLQAIPLDDFDGKPLRYSRDLRRIWSVGKDLIDSNGRTYKEVPKSDDILFEIELKPTPTP